MPDPNSGFRVVNGPSRNFIEMRETRSANCGFRVANNFSRNFIEIYEKCLRQSAEFALSMIFRASLLRNTRDAVPKLRISRSQWNFAQFYREIRETPSANCGFLVVNGNSRNLIEKYEKRRLQTVDSMLSMIFRAISSRSTRSNVPELWTSCVNSISRNFIEIREAPVPNCGFFAAECFSRNFNK